MTGNAAQAIVADEDWAGTVRAVHDVLAPQGHFVFETREPSKRAWELWNRAQSHVVVDGIERWEEVTAVDLPFVTFVSTTVLPGGERLEATSTLRFRERDEVEADLAEHGFVVREIRDAPDRPGRELVFIAQAARHFAP